MCWSGVVFLMVSMHTGLVYFGIDNMKVKQTGPLKCIGYTFYT